MGISGEAGCVVVTGGASGIGAATVERVVAGGGCAAILDLNIAPASSLARRFPGKIFPYRANLLDEAEVRKVHAKAAVELPPIVGLVNCAGIPQVPCPIEEYTVDSWAAVIDSHLKTTYIACRVIGAAMAERGGGAIVNLASVLAFRSGPVLAYGPAKAGVVNLTEALAVQWASRGLRVNAVAPGWTDTPFLRPADRRGKRDLRPILDATPIGRLMRPEEIAEVIGFLLSPLASAVTGATIPCDGGVIAASGWPPYGGIPRARAPA
ncbi:MAG: SDR family oxidoreductase [Candidimonas sp.]|nr:MAG: SDR family oxidoreductase [Candidimonas sp.]